MMSFWRRKLEKEVAKYNFQKENASVELTDDDLASVVAGANSEQQRIAQIFDERFE